MYQLLVSIDSAEEGSLLRRKLGPILTGPEGLRLELASPQGLAARWDGGAVAAVISAGVFREAHRAAFRALRDAGFEGPILVIAKDPERELAKAVEKAGNAYLLERPYDSRDLIGLLNKFRDDRSVAQRHHRRFPVAASAQLEIEGERARSTVRNLSRGGALLEIEEGPLPARGSSVVVTIALKDLRKSYALPARVVWSSIGGGDALPSVGVEFTGPGDVRRILIGNFSPKREDRGA